MKEHLGTSLLASASSCPCELRAKPEAGGCELEMGWALTLLVCALQSPEKGWDYLSSQEC